MHRNGWQLIFGEHKLMERGLAKNMQETQVKEISESKVTESQVRQTIPKSSFDDAEYQRWTEKLRSATSKDK